MAHKQDLQESSGFFRVLESVPAVGHITGICYNVAGNHEKANRAYARANNGTVATLCVVGAVACAPVAATTGTIVGLAAAGGAVGAAAGNGVQVLEEAAVPSTAEGGNEASEKNGKQWAGDIVGGAIGGAVGGYIAPAGALKTNAMQPLGNVVVGESVEIGSTLASKRVAHMAAKRGVEKLAATACEAGAAASANAVAQSGASACGGAAGRGVSHRAASAA